MEWLVFNNTEFNANIGETISFAKSAIEMLKAGENHRAGLLLAQVHAGISKNGTALRWCARLRRTNYDELAKKSDECLKAIWSEFIKPQPDLGLVQQIATDLEAHFTNCKTVLKS